MKYWDTCWYKEVHSDIRVYENEVRIWAGLEADDELDEDLITDFALEQINSGDWDIENLYLNDIIEGEEEDE